MLTVTVPDPEILEGLQADLPDGVRLVPWDLSGPLPAEVGERGVVDMVVLPHQGLRREMFGYLQDLPGLRVVQLPSAGYEHAVEHLPAGVLLCNGRGVHDAGTAELALALVLASQRGIDDAVRAMDEQRWEPRRRSSLADRRVMVLGYGSIGAAVARRLDAFEVEVVAVARTAREQDDRHVHGYDELPELVPSVDVVVVVVPLTEETDRMVDAGLLALLPDGALVVNVSRGKVVDTEALLAELERGRLRAGLDVTDPEPLPADHPLWKAPGLVLTPHVGGYTDATTPRLVALLRRQVHELVQGREPVNVVVRA